jgi:uncharacterized protein (TIGR02001 family)
MKKLLIGALALVAITALPISMSFAAESSANVALTSNYVFRGQTKTDDDPAIQGGYDIKQSKDDIGWYAGAFASTVDKGVEVDLYGGWKGAFGNQSNLGYDVGAIFYQYSDSQYTDTTEIYAGVNYETAYVKLYIGNGSGIESYNYLDVGASFVILKDVDLDLHAGRYLSSPSSNDISAAVSMDVKGFDLGLGVTYEDAGAKNDFEFFVTVGKTFDL